MGHVVNELLDLGYEIIGEFIYMDGLWFQYDAYDTVSNATANGMWYHAS